MRGSKSIFRGEGVEFQGIFALLEVGRFIFGIRCKSAHDK